MKTYEFTLFIDGMTESTDEFANAMFEAGCDDGTCGSSCGRVFIAFDREADSFLEAVLSAISDVHRGGYQVWRIDEADQVTQSDIARRLSVSRQMVHQYVSGQRGPGDFPPPMSDTKSGQKLWSWGEVAEWLHVNNFLDEEIVEQSSIINVINSFLSIRREEGLKPQLVKTIRKAVLS
ncbi:hypothetical protein CA54_03210 [Symmachiella macrocystis]|uniref:Helix-turn-helix domain protein n=1 Tax=Symmachiella macrocystis TaxID=2527985 RepID=A0A5C6BLZ6_9PLAN|nr:helix-turn-helix transcriptional regulator [Symmachiella macrocystis]TWU11514.1 hypothetical protein CA54_03210 [Symmachiella macrocystis]